MKAFLLSATLFLMPALAVHAQAPGSISQPQQQRIQRSNPQKAAARLSRKLGLSTEQQARLEPILAERRQKVQAIRANTQISEAERHHQLKTIHRDARQQLSSILTPDQTRQMKAMHHARHTDTPPPTGV